MSEPPSVLRAPAKLTRSLRVRGTRSDGYHLLEAEMISLDWGDDLHIRPGDGLEVEDRLPRADGLGGGAGEGSWGRVPTGRDNLVLRALAAAGRRAAVRLVKRVPPGAGLGGGSSDAAAMLRWAGVAADDAGLRLAAGLGADVPFCLAGGRARVSGIGEVVEPLAPLDLGLSLLLAPFGMSTPAVYRRWDQMGGAPSEGANDLEEAALSVEPRLGRWRDAWAQATGLRPVLAGSGSTWFVEEARPDLAGPFPPPDGSGPPGYVIVTRSDRP